MLLRNSITTVDNALLDHDLVHKTLSAEISTLHKVIFSRLYDDACDMGIAVHNSKRDTTTFWYIDKELITPQDPDQEVYGWELRPCSESIRTFPAIEQYKLTLWND
jgi:hypothetical protein